MDTRTYTTETRIPGHSALAEYLDKFVPDYSTITRNVWHEVASPDFSIRFPRLAMYITYLCTKHGILKRTANSIYHDVTGRMKALMELKKTELKQLGPKITALEARVSRTGKELDRLKPLAAANRLTCLQLKRYQAGKESLYWAKNRLNKYRQRKAKLEHEIKNRVYSICYGTKAMFRKQWNLAANGYKSHAKWRNDFRKSRDRMILYIGSSDETAGNQLCQLKYDRATDIFRIQLRKECRYCAGTRNPDKYVILGNIKFKYLGNKLADILSRTGTGRDTGQPLTYRFCRKGRAWYIKASFSMAAEPLRTTSKYGVIALDYNEGFIEKTETDESGNAVYQEHVILRHHGTGGQAETDVREAVAKIIHEAGRKGKDVVIENLDFGRKKSKTVPAVSRNGKKYNRMLYAFDYSRYIKTIGNTAFTHQVRVTKVNPAYTSKIGKQKYAGPRKMTIHEAASLVIGRRAQGYIDKLAT